jgi:flagellar basal body rod protein FlgC
MEPKELNLPTSEVSRSRRELAKQLIRKLFKSSHEKAGVEYNEPVTAQVSEVPKASDQIAAMAQRRKELSLKESSVQNSAPRTAPEGFSLKVTGAIDAEQPKELPASHFDPNTPEHQSQRYVEKSARLAEVIDMDAARKAREADPYRHDAETPLGNSAVRPAMEVAKAKIAAQKAFEADPLGAPKELVPEAPDNVYQNLVKEHFPEDSKSA